MDNGIQSQERVKQFGEVFTPDSIVTDMVKLVDDQLADCTANEYISKVYLEPACGDGQFLIRILSNKMERIKELPADQQKLALVKALCSIHGIDIQSDNITKAQERMKSIALGKSVDTFDITGKNTIQVKLDIDYDNTLIDTIDWILNQNITVGNTLDDSIPPYLTDYKFNGEMVSTCRCPLNDLQVEIDKQPETHYLSLAKSIEVNYSDDDDWE